MVPAFTSANTASVAENSQTVITLTATDADAGSTVSFDIVDDGVDNAYSPDSNLFTLTGAALTFTNAPDYESAPCSSSDGGTQVCVLVVSATDNTQTAVQTITVTITDVNEATPDYGAAVAVDVAENTQTVGTYTATDADGDADLSYTISGGDDSTLFSIGSSDGVLTFDSAPNYEGSTCTSDNGGVNVCVVDLEVTDGTNTDTKTITVTITDADDVAPSFTTGSTTVSVAEGTSADVDSFSITDSDSSDSDLVCAESGADASIFSCDISGSTLTISWDSAPDYDTAGDSDADNEYVYTITVGDGTNDASAVTYTVTVTDTNDQAPSYSSSDTTPSVSEGSTAVETLTVTDTDTADSNSCTLAGDDASKFACTVNGDSVSLAFATAPIMNRLPMPMETTYTT